MLKIDQPQAAVDQVVEFIRSTFKAQGRAKAVIAVSGGIDSAVSLTLLVKALGTENVTALLLPYGDQPIEFGRKMVEFNHLAADQVLEINIKDMVDQVARTLDLTEVEAMRLGNVKARMRMICVFDAAKKLEALVCGTENKSEHYLGYFTRFGDAASDLEPIAHWYKTQIRAIATELQLPAEIIDQAPSAGLWLGQTDEAEMGFTYAQADEVMEQLIEQGKPESEITLSDGGPNVVAKIIKHIHTMAFKRAVPYQVTTKE